MPSKTLDDLRTAAAEAVRAPDKLLEVWRHVEESKLALDSNSNDIALLREADRPADISQQRFYGLLVQFDREAAIELLLSRYLGKAVDPDTKFGGFEFELATMLEDLREAGGEECLGKLVRHPQFSMGRIADQRVRRVFSEVLRLDEKQISAWVQSQQEAHDER